MVEGRAVVIPRGVGVFVKVRNFVSMKGTASRIYVVAWPEQPQTYNALMATNAPFSFTAITSVKVIINSRNFMARKLSLARRVTDGSTSFTTATRAWRTCHGQESPSRPQQSENTPSRSSKFQEWCVEVVGRDECFKGNHSRERQGLQKGRKLSLITSHRLSCRSALTLALCYLIAPSILNGLVFSLPKMKNESRIIILTTPSNGVISIKILVKRPTRRKKDKLCFFFCSERSVYCKILGEGETVGSILFCKQLEEMGVRDLAATCCSWWTTRDLIMRI